MSQPGNPKFNPFPGLRPFQVEEEYLFFGRDQQRQELISLLKNHRFVAVLGVSGGGKSSLVRAGLLPALYGGVMVSAGSHWNIAIMRPGGSPLRALAEALREADLWDEAEPPSVLELETTLNRSGLGLVEAVRQAKMPATENLLVVVDQFEELFRFNQSQSERSTRGEASAFVNLLLESARQTSHSIYVVLTMRSDFFGDCAQFEELAEAINRGEYLVPWLSRDQKKQAIEGPIKVGGGTIAPRLMQRLLNDVGDDPDQLPILQHALMRTWDHWLADRSAAEPLDLRHYEGIGGMREALSRHADEVFESLASDRLRTVAEKVFKALTERGPDNRGIRRPTRVRQLAAIANATVDEVTTVVDAFRKTGCTFLMPPDSVPLSEETVVDISHESLMRVWQRLRRWVEDEAQSARIYRRLSDTALLHLEGNAGLYRNPDLQIALSWRESEHPTAAWAARYHAGFADAMAFLDQSAEGLRAEEAAREAARKRELDQAKALAEAERRRAEAEARSSVRLRSLVRGLGLVAMVAITATIIALSARKAARSNAELAQANEAEATRQAQRAATLAGEARQAQERTRAALVLSDFEVGTDHLENDKTDLGLAYLARALRNDTNFWPASFRILTALSEHTWRLEPPKIIRASNPIEWMDYRQTGPEWLFTRTKEKEYAVWNAESMQLLAELPAIRKGSEALWSPDDQVFVCINTNGEAVRVLPTRPASEWKVFRPPSKALQIAVGGKGSSDWYAAVSLEDGAIQLIHGADWSAGPLLKAEGRVLGAPFILKDLEMTGAAFSDQSLRFWSVKTGELLGRIPFEASSSRYWALKAGAVAIHEGINDARGENNRIEIWDLRTFKIRGAVPLPGATLNDHAEILLSPDELVLLVNYHPRNISTFPIRAMTIDLVAGKLVHQFVKDQVTPQHVAHVPTGLYAFSHRDGSIEIASMSDGRTISRISPEDRPIRDISFSPSGDKLIVLGQKYSLTAWDVRKGTPLFETIRFAQSRGVIKMTPDEQRVLVGTLGLVELWDLATGRMVWKAVRPDLVSFRDDQLFTRDGKALFTRFWMTFGTPMGSQLIAGEIHKLNLQGGEATYPDRMFGEALWEESIVGARFAPDGGRLFILENQDREAQDDTFARSVDTKTGKVLQSFRHRAQATGLTSPAVAMDRHATAVAGGFNDGTIVLFDAQSGKATWEVTRPANIERLQFSPDGSRLASAFSAGSAFFGLILDSATGQPISPEIKLATNLFEIEFSPDGGRFAIAGYSTNAEVWNVLDGARLNQFAHPQPIGAVSFSPDGARLITACWDNRVRLWDLANGKLVREFNHEDWAWAILVSPDGQQMVTGGTGANPDFATTQFRLWDLDTGQSLGQTMNLTGRAEYGQATLDWTMLFASAVNGNGRLWHLPTGRPLTASLLERNERIRSLNWRNEASITADGRFLAIPFQDRRVRLIGLPPSQRPIPEWIGPLAEALSGSRLTDSGRLEPAPEAAVGSLREKIEPLSALDDYSRWLRWFFARPDQRAVAPFDQTTFEEHFQNLVLEDTEDSLNDALKLKPLEARLHARLARKLAAKVDQSDQADPHFFNVALARASKAAKLNPQDAEARWTLADLLDRFGFPGQALEEAAEGLALAPDDSSLLLAKAFALRSLDRAGESALAFSSALSRINLALSESEFRARFPLWTGPNLTARLNQGAQAAELNRALLKLPERPPRAPESTIDLTAFYNAALNQEFTRIQGLRFQSFKPGLHHLAGVDFDVRGLIYVARGNGPAKVYPSHVEGIAVERKAALLHFLHARDGGGGLQGAEYVIHYVDGAMERLTCNSERIGDWMRYGPESDLSEFTERVMVDGPPANQLSHDRLQVFRTTWINPSPEKMIRSIDLICPENAASFLLAITVDPGDWPQITTQPKSLSLANGESGEMEVKLAKLGPWQFQWSRDGADLPGETNASLRFAALSREQIGQYQAKVRSALPGAVAWRKSRPAYLSVKTNGFIHGAVRYERYLGITGNRLETLTNHFNFPARPDETLFRFELAAPEQAGENFGSRMTGYITAPKTGEYRFFLAADDESHFLLSSNAAPENRRLICSVPSWMFPLVYFPTQGRSDYPSRARPGQLNISQPIKLEEGQRYYFEAIHKEGAIGDHLAVTWQLPGEPEPFNGHPPIPGRYLSCDANADVASRPAQ